MYKIGTILKPRKDSPHYLQEHFKLLKVVPRPDNDVNIDEYIYCETTEGSDILKGTILQWHVSHLEPVANNNYVTSDYKNKLVRKSNV